MNLTRKNFLKKLIFLFFVFCSNILFADWVEVTLPSRQGTSEITGLYFVNDTLGFLAINDSNGLYRTENAGVTWQTYTGTSFELPIGASTIVDAKFDFISNQIGFLLIETDNNGLHLYKTTNSGIDWSYLYNVGGGHGDVDFYNEQYGVTSKDNYIHITSNGGQTWTKVKPNAGLSINSLLHLHVQGIDTISCQYTSGAFYTSNGGSSFTKTSSSNFSYLEVSFRDSVGYATIGTGLYRTVNGGLTWGLVNTDSDYNNYQSLFIRSLDTLLAGKDVNIVRSPNQGANWFKQPSSVISPTGKYNIICGKKNRVFAANGGAYRLFYTDDMGGCSTPVITTSGSIKSACSEDSIDIVTTNNPDYQYFWKYKDDTVFYGKDLHWRLPTIYNTGYNELYLFGSVDGMCYDSTAQGLNTYASPNPPDMVACLETYVNCTNNKNIVKVYPYSSAYTYKYSPDTTTSYYSMAYNSYSGDTGIFEADIDYAIDYTIQASISNGCGSGSTEAVLVKGERPYDFDLSLVEFDKDYYCSYDTVHIILSRSEPGTKYWINATLPSDKISNPDTLSGNGSILVFSVTKDKIEATNLSLFCQTNKGCTNSLNIPSYTIESGVFYTNSEKDLYRKTDTIKISRSTYATDSLCTWTVGNYMYDTTFSDHAGMKAVLGYPGEYHAFNTVISKNNCIYWSDSSFFIVADSNEVASEDPVCTKDTNIMKKQYLDIHRDNKGNFYTAGYNITNSLAGTPNAVPMMYFAKYGPDRELIWEFNSETRTNYSSPFFGYAHGLAITADSASNVYIAGQTASNTYFSFDSLTYTNYKSNTRYAFIAKLDSSANLLWFRLFEPDNYYAGSTVNCFSDIEIVDGRIFVTSDMRQYGKIRKPVTKDTWEVVLDNFAGDNLLEFDPDGNIVSVEDISDGYSSRGVSFVVYGEATGIMYSKSIQMEVDGQKRLNIYLNRKFSDPEGRVGNQVLNTGTTRYNEINAVYDINQGFIGAQVINNFDVSIRENNPFRHLASDSYGNKYFIANSNTMPIYDHGRNIVAKTKTGTYGSWLLKFDADNKLLWEKRILNARASDIFLTRDESRLFVVLFPTASNTPAFEVDDRLAYFSKDNHEPMLLRINPDGEIVGCSDLDVSINYSSTGNTYFSLNYLTTDTNHVVNYMNRSYRAKLYNDNNNCNEESYTKPINDTLFLVAPEIKSLCANSNILLTWISTVGIENLKLGYFANSYSEKKYIKTDIKANSYALPVGLQNIGDVDSLAFFIESNDDIYSDTLQFIKYHKNIDLINFSSVTITKGDTLAINMAYQDLTYLWEPSAEFSDASSGYQEFTFYTPFDTTKLQALDTISGCVSYDTLVMYKYDPDVANVFNTHPQNHELVCAGGPVNFSVNGNNINNYVWQVSTDSGSTWTELLESEKYTGPKTSQLTVYPDNSSDSSLFRCFVTTDEFPSGVYSNPGLLTIDTVSPYLSLKDITKSLNAEGMCLITATEVIDSIYDGCGISDTTLSRTQFSATDTGNVSLTVSVTDFSGNVTSLQCTITIIDNLPPVPVLDTLPLISGACFASITEYPLASDNVSGTVTGITDNDLSYTEQGLYTITWVYTDNQGNSSSQMQQVLISDTTKPVIRYEGQNFTRIVAKESYVVDGKEFDPYEVDDDCGINTLINDYNNRSTLENDTLEKGNHSITWTATDINGNVSHCKINISIEGYSGIENYSRNNYTIYPNPVDEQINIHVNSGKIVDVLLTDISGMTVECSKEMSPTGSVINLSSLPAGIYFLLVQTDRDKFVERIIKK